MKPFLRPLPILLVIAILALVAFGQVTTAAICLVALLAVLAISSMRAGARLRSNEPVDEFDPEARALYVPIRRLAREIEEAVESGQGSTAVRVIGADAITESRRIADQAAHALGVRTALRRATRERNVALAAEKDLTERIAGARSDAERGALEGALDAKRLEIAHYTQADSALRRIDADVQAARTALAEIRARLATVAVGERASDTDALRESISELHSLTLSVDEAEQFLRG